MKMSELINNREQPVVEGQTRRQEMLKQIIKELHDGVSVEEVKARFEEAVGDVTVSEISAMEHALMEEEGIPVSEVQRLCSVHTAIFKGSIEEIHRSSKPEEQPGHPVHTFKLENREIERLINFKLSLHLDKLRKAQEQGQEDISNELLYKLLEDLNLLLDIDKHYSRKENLLFPYLEKYGIYGPTKVMWGVDDGIRAMIKEVKNNLAQYSVERSEIDKETLFVDLERIITEVNEMVFKEEHILLPMALEKLTEDEWVKIAEESDEIGFCLAAPDQKWVPDRVPLKDDTVEVGSELADDRGDADAPQGFVKFQTGFLSVEQLEAIMNHLPVDLTFIDENDVVRYFSHGKERIFARTKAVIGRTVQNCHPPQSVHVVNQLLIDFKSGKKDAEDFWIQMKDKFVYIRYFAVRSEDGRYLGTLEFTQNIAPIQALEGQKRILS